jgi:sporulation and spore germination protein
MKLKLKMGTKKLPRAFALYAGLAAVLVGGLVLLLVMGPRWLATVPEETAAVSTPAAEARKIRARLFYVDEQGTALTGVEREVLYGEGTLEQAKRIVEAQLAAAPEAFVSAIPQDTKLRRVFFTKTGDMYVDLSNELRHNHPGGTTSEILTVYAIVSALTSNLPAVTGVQILIDGKEVDTLAGHLDLRRPIEQDLKWISN